MSESHPEAGIGHDDAWALLPWYITGTLEPDEHRAVERHLAGCDACAAELKTQRRLAECVREQCLAEEAAERQWAVLRARIAGDKRAALDRPVAADRGRVVPLRARRAPVVALGGLAVAAALALALFLPDAQQQTGQAPFVTLTTPNDGARNGVPQGPVLRVRVDERVSPADVSRLATAEGLFLLDGPTEGNVYTLAGGDAAALEQGRKALAGVPGVLFVTVRPVP